MSHSNTIPFESIPVVFLPQSLLPLLQNRHRMIHTRIRQRSQRVDVVTADDLVDW